MKAQNGKGLIIHQMNPLLRRVLKNDHQRRKWEQLTQLAGSVTDGVIVEFGTYLGYGTIALYDGATVPVYTVDDYRNRKGWAGEIYYPNDYLICKRNLINADVHPICLQFDVRELEKYWDEVAIEYQPISLLFWDLGTPSRLCGDFEAWEQHIRGKFVIHDTEDNRLGSDLLKPEGWTKKKEGVFWVLERLFT